MLFPNQHTTIIDMLNTMADELSGHDLFAEQALVRCSRQVMIGPHVLRTAKAALCHCGVLHGGDIIVVNDG